MKQILTLRKNLFRTSCRISQWLIEPLARQSPEGGGEVTPQPPDQPPQDFGPDCTPKAIPCPNTSPRCISNGQQPPSNRFHGPLQRSRLPWNCPQSPPRPQANPWLLAPTPAPTFGGCMPPSPQRLKLPLPLQQSTPGQCFYSHIELWDLWGPGRFQFQGGAPCHLREACSHTRAPSCPCQTL